MKRIAIGLIFFISAFLGAREVVDGNRLLSLNNIVAAQASSEPELPRVYLDSTYPASPGASINVAAGGNLQAALNQAQPGDQIVLQAGAVFTGNYTLPTKTGNNWIVIRTSNLAELPAEGARATASHAAAMAKIVTPNTQPAIKTAAASHHYRLVGIELGIAAGTTLNYGIICLGDGGATQNSMSLVPHDFVIDRCYVHGNATGDVSRGVALNSGATAIIDSTIANCHGVGFDTQAIGGWNGPGPFKIVNNTLEGAGENFMLGGADPKIANLVPSDLEFRCNTCTKPLSWCATEPTYAGVHWSIKNHFELKNAQRVLIDGNIFENCWVDGQTGMAVQLTPRNQEGTAPWSTVQDVTFTNNIVRSAAAGINILGRDDIQTSQQAQRFKIKNNLFNDIGGARWGGNGRLFQIINGPANVQIDHNTAFQTNNVISADGAPTTGFVFTNNLVPHNAYGIIGSGYGIGNSTLNHYFPACVFARNVLVGAVSSVYPSNNFFPALMAAVGFVDLAGGNFRLGISSLYSRAATDGTDIGVNFDALQAAINGEPTGNLPPQVSIAATPSTGAAPLNVTFTSNATDADGSIVAYSWNFGDNQTANAAAPSHTYQSAGSYTAQLTVTDNSGASASSSIVISATGTAPPPPPPPATVVLYASEATARAGNWQIVADTTAAGGARIWNPDAGAAKINTAAAAPASYFEITFTAPASTPYHLWLRGKAQNDSPYNDSVHVQFSDSINASGAPVFRIGTTDSTVINLEDDLNLGVRSWGWQDNGWGAGVMGENLYFATPGTHTLRVQVREDGLSIDQIVLSATTYLSVSPGALKNDTVILPKTPAALAVTAASPASGTSSGGMTFALSGDGFQPGATVQVGNLAAVSVNVINAHTLTAVTPAHAAGSVDLMVINPGGGSATLASGYTYLAANQPPQVSPTASATTGQAPLIVNFVANATDADGDALSLAWNFGDGQTAAGAAVSHIYASAGQFSASVKATDPSGAFASAAITITVAPDPRPLVQVFTPLTGQKALAGMTTLITWTASGETLLNQTVQLSVDGGATWQNVVTDLPDSMSRYTWKVPNLPTTTARIRVRAYDRSGVWGEAMNPGNFTIAAKLKGQNKSKKH